jgi:hypothetical protein
MAVCFRASVGGLVAAGAMVVCAPNASADSVHRGKAAIRVDHSGRLVRSVVVPGKRTQKPAEKPSQPTIVTAPDTKLNEIVEAAAKQYDVDPLLVHSVIQVESNYKSKAVSPKGAQGIMQLIPATARRFGVTDSFDPKQNVEAGVRYLKFLGTMFSEDLTLALAAYNAGEGAVLKYGNSIPPYRETEQYVQNVGRRYVEARTAADKKKQQVAPAVDTASAAAEEKHPPVEFFLDSEGRLNLRTRPAEMESTP